MRHEPKSDRKASVMRTVILSLLFTLLVCAVYAADISELLTGSISYITYNTDGNSENPKWTYSCEDKCKKELIKSDTSTVLSLETCIMLCRDLPLWPKPTEVKVTDKDVSTFSKNRILIKLNVPDEIRSDLKEASNIFMNNLPISDELWIDESDTVLVNIIINVNSTENVLKISTNEDYLLSVKKLEDTIQVDVSSSTYFGARHGLETLSQLIWLDTFNKKLNIIHDVEINDKPKFAHRGLMVDTARNYFYIEQLRKVVDGMAATKLNVLHLHLTDASSFPIVLPRNELFAKYGAYGPEMVYTPENIKDLVEYARIRGIRVILEIDAPSHVTPNLNAASENLVICGDDTTFNGHLNPENNETFHVLEDIYRDLLDLGSDNEMFHIGGDEVNLTCWQQITKSTDRNTIGRVLHNTRNKKAEVMPIWINFINNMFDTLMSANEDILPQHIVLWSSDLTDNYISQLNYKNNIVVQYWYGSIKSILANGNKVIFSTVGRWYLDCGFGSWKTSSKDSGVCDPYATWHTFYKYRPWVDEFSDYKEQVLGGEACLWSEEVEVDSLETRIWPRTAALAERLWSDPDTFDRHDVYMRLDIHRERLKRRDIKSEAIWPRWCSQNPGKC